MARGFATVAISTLVLLVACLVFAPSSVSLGARAGSLPFAAVIAIVGLDQLLVVQQGGVDLSVTGGVSLAVVIAAHYPNGDNTKLLPAVLLAAGFALAAGLANGILVGFVRLNAIIATIGVNVLLYGGCSPSQAAYKTRMMKRSGHWRTTPESTTATSIIQGIGSQK